MTFTGCDYIITTVWSHRKVQNKLETQWPTLWTMPLFQTQQIWTRVHPSRALIYRCSIKNFPMFHLIFVLLGQQRGDWAEAAFKSKVGYRGLPGLRRAPGVIESCRMSRGWPQGSWGQVMRTFSFCSCSGLPCSCPGPEGEMCFGRVRPGGRYP